MKSKYFIFVTFLFFSSLSIYSQSKINFSIGGGFLTSLNSSDKLQYWNNGYSINFDLEYFVNNNFALSAYTSYQNYFYDGSSLQLAAPAVLGYNMQTNVENTKAYQLSLKAKYYISSSSFINSFISIGTGILEINQGAVVITSWMDGEETSKNSNTLKGSNNNYFIGQFSLGPGFGIRLNDTFRLLVEGDLISSFKGDIIYFPVTASLKFRL